MKKLYAAIIIICALAFTAGLTAEIDSVTPRKLKLDDSLSAVNEIFEQRMKEGIEKANAESVYVEEIYDMEFIEVDDYCDEAVLYTELRKSIFQSFTASWGLKGYDLDKQLRRLLARNSYSLLLNDSIYRDIDYIEGFSLNLKELSDVVNINGHLVGLDKIGHYFSEGWRYYELTHHDGLTIEQALEWGKEKETGLFGFTTTGIFSYSDLTANFNGWRFWNKILLKHDDPLKGVIANFFNRPYVTCEIQIIDSIRNRKIVKAWEYNARFDLSEYIDGAWDEGNNCNSYADPVIEEKVTTRINNIDPGFSCPFSAGHCSDAQDKYAKYAKHVLHPYCLIAQ